MEKISFNTGVKEYQLGELGTLRANFSDPNFCDRFVKGTDVISQIEKEVKEKEETLDKNDTKSILNLLNDFDSKVKDELNKIFLLGNDFHKLCGGMNLLAVADNGKNLLTNLLNALAPLIKDGIKQYSDAQVKDAKMARNARRDNQ